MPNQTILFLAANPTDTQPLRMDQELRDIGEGLQRAKQRDQFRLEQRMAVRPRDIQRAMLDLNPQMIHFSGHGAGNEGLVFEDESGKTKFVTGEALADLFSLFADQLNCVVLNGCYSEVQAKVIAQHIPYVIGMNQAIGDKAAIAFAVGFYDALGAGRDVEFAFKLGCSAIRLGGIAEHLTPVLIKKLSVNKKVRYEFVLSGSIEEIDKHRINAIFSHLQTLVGDPSLTLIKVESGSIKLILEGSFDGFNHLSRLIETGELREILGIPIQGMEMTSSINFANNNELKPMPPPSQSNPIDPIKVFISYSHRDDELKDTLITHLANLKRQKKIAAWQDRAIEGGQEWEAQIKQQLESAQIILLLISPDFMASDYCYDIEMERAIARHDARTARVIPVILRPCDWKDSPFSKLQALPKDAKPITQWSDRDDAFLDVVQGIRRAVESPIKKVDQPPGKMKLNSSLEHPHTQLQENTFSSMNDQLECAEVRPRLWLEELSRRKILLLVGSISGALSAWAISRFFSQKLENLPSGPLQNPIKNVTKPNSNTSAKNLSKKVQKVEFTVATVNSSNQTIKEKRRIDLLMVPLGSGIILEMASIPAGSFQMGSLPMESKDKADERPQHLVKTPAFWMGIHTITQSQWKTVASWKKVQYDLTPDPSVYKGDNHPVEKISWFEAVEFCNRLSRNLGRRYRLPSEAEWEYACRGGTKTPFHFGETLTPDLANYDHGLRGTTRGQTTEVGSFKVANEFGLYDMHGNVMEWCQDHWHSNYDGAPNDGGEWEMKAKPASQVTRGGSWNNASWECRSASRSNYGAKDKEDVIGFRVVFSE
jgi:formylglycine-generating enzyme required for sulfatase activity